MQAASLKRTAFTTKTQKAIPVSRGEHRRHIISNHLMKNALNAWWEAHKKDSEGAKIKFGDLKALFDKMNNYQPNLKAGPGAENSAIGMFTTMASMRVESFSESGATPSEMKTDLSKMRGFHIGTQHMLVDPVLPALTTDSAISASSDSALAFVVDLVDSTDFDWPDGADPKYYKKWEEAYNAFLSLQKNAASYPYEGLMAVCKFFLTLPDPGP